MPETPIPDTVLTALRLVWQTLEPEGAPMALMGGIALASWKYARATRDIDLLLDAAQVPAERLIETLKASGLRAKHASLVVSLGELDLLQFLFQPPNSFLDIQVDLLLGKSAYHRKALERRMPLHVPAMALEVDVLSCEDLILHKLLAGRLIDLADSAALLAANRDSLDYAYLAEWIVKLQLLPSFKQAWESAWPGTPLPRKIAP